MSEATNPELGRIWLDETALIWHRNKGLADAAIAQLSNQQLHRTLDPEVNSISVVMKHVAGNLRSRWTDFLTTDGEKPGRNRDDEFIDDDLDHEAALARWEAGWAVLFGQLDALTPEDLLRTVEVRGERMTVPQAILRSITHCSYHIGQIVQTARIIAGDSWQTLTIPRGQSEAYNRERWEQG